MTTEVIQNETSAKIAALNDAHRRSMQGCTVTKGIIAMGSAANEVFVGVRDYAAFTEDNDPYGEQASDQKVACWLGRHQASLRRL